jgi:hypothetical protein
LLHYLEQGFQNLLLCERVEIGCRFIQDQDL